MSTGSSFTQTEPDPFPAPTHASRAAEAGRRRGERAHRLGLVVNGLLAGLKLGGGLLAGSPALTADGVHSLADLATNGIAWFSFRVAARPPDEDHHFGHGKAEAVAGALVGAVLAFAGLGVLVDAFRTGAPEYAGLQAPVALAVAVVSIFANEWLTRVTVRAADELDSHALRALARDNRSDSLTGALVIVGIGGSLVGGGWAELLVSALIGILVAVMGARSFREGLDVLMDRVDDPDLRRRCEQTALGVTGVLGVQRLRIHRIGSAYLAEIEVSVDAEATVRRGHEIAHAVERAVVAAERGIVQVTVHVNPATV